jgi:hypothetical protein
MTVNREKANAVVAGTSKTAKAHCPALHAARADGNSPAVTVPGT